MATADPIVAPVEALKNLGLAEKTEKMTGPEFWAQYLRSHMEPLLQAVGSYTPEEQAAQMKVLVDHVAPSLGPLPTDPHGQYTMTYVDCPFEPSLNLTSAGKAKVRYEFEVVKPAGREKEDPFGENVARELLPRLAEAVGADTKWLKSLMDTFFLTPAEAETIRGKLPSFMPCCMLAFDCDGSKTMMKAYIPAIRKAITSGQSCNDFILNAVKGLEPLGSELAPGLDIVSEYAYSFLMDDVLH
jgi:DMATS type aromatic prenyltransferase